MSTGSQSTPPPNDISPVLPEKFLGLFRPRRCGGDLDSSLPAQFKVTLNLADLDISPPVDPLPTGVKAGVQVFHDEAVALYSDPAADPINLTLLKDLTNQLGQDFFQWQSVSLDYVYIGMVAVVPVAIYDYIEFVYDDNTSPDSDNEDSQIIELVEDRMRPNCYTRINSAPWNGYPEEFQHWDQDSFSGDCVDSHDRTPGLLMLVPGANSDTGGSGSSIKLAASVLTLEDGRLVKTYNKEDIITCGCSTVPPCGQVCVTITGIGDLSGVTITAKTQPIDHVIITNGGAGYTSPPGVTFSTLNGNSGAGTAVLDGSGHVIGVTITSGGAYTGSVIITFINAGHGGTGAAGTVVLAALTDISTCITDGVVTGISITNAGSGYTTIAPLTISGGGGGTGVVAVVSMKLVAPITLISGGSGYVAGQVINLVGGTFTTVATIRVTTVAAGTGAITAASIQGLGSYQVLPPNPTSISGGTAGTGALFGFVWAVASVSVTNGGTGFTSAPTITFGVPGSTGGIRALGSAGFAFRCCLGVFVSGKYSISTNACTPASTLVTVTCPANTNVTIAASGLISISFPTCGNCFNTVAATGPTQVRMTGFGITATANKLPGGTCDLFFAISRPGVYTFTLLDGACYVGETHTVNVATCISSPPVLTINPIPKTYTKTINIFGCGLPLFGATITVSGGPGYFNTQTSNAAGFAVFTNMPADCDMVVTGSYPRFVSVGPIGFRSGCSDDAINTTVNFNTPIPGFHCAPCVAYPLPESLIGADSEGGFVLLWSGSFWSGCHAVTGKTLVCLSNPANCEARLNVGGTTFFYSGPNAAIGWVFSAPGFPCGLRGAIPGSADPNDVDIHGSRYYPVAACCSGGFDPATDGVGYTDDTHCGGTGTHCTSGFQAGCGTSPAGTPVGGYPLSPPFNATWSVSPVARMSFPTGTVTISE